MLCSSVAALLSSPWRDATVYYLYISAAWYLQPATLWAGICFACFPEWINNGSPICHQLSSCFSFPRRFDVDCIPAISPAAKANSLCPKHIIHCLATGWEEDKSLTLENEDVVAMGTVNPSVTQRMPGWWGTESVAFHDTQLICMSVCNLAKNQHVDV